MNRKKTAALLEDRLKDVSDTVIKVAPGFEEDDIHAFRVAVKKLRAYMRLVSSADKQPKLILSKKFHELYDIAGAIREAQLRLKKAGAPKDKLAGYIADLEHRIAFNKEEWQKKYNEDVVKKLSKKLTGKDLKKLPDKTLTAFMKDKMQVLEDAADTSPNDETIHECRKSVKDMLYNTKLAEKHWPGAFKKVEHLPLSKLDELSDMLGDYNDERLLLESHLAFIALSTTAEEQKRLSAISNKENIAKAQQKQVLLKELKKFVTATAI
ncbi:MAG: CHAD domain-containing protein [Bacteroidetes bacterium]|nr:CHAD domain-containing protein [Bacteroidota bacterium]